jgi:hypothetical protein
MLPFVPVTWVASASATSVAAVAAEAASAVVAAGQALVALLLPRDVGPRRAQVVADLRVVAHRAVVADLRAAASAVAVALRQIRSYSAVTAGSLYTRGKPRWAVEPRSR